MMKSHRVNAEKDKLIKEDKRTGISEIIRQNNGNIQSKKKKNILTRLRNE